jgi:hypothetical protein
MRVVRNGCRNNFRFGCHRCRIGAFSVAGVQLYVGHRQSEAALKAADAALMNAQSAGRHTVAEFRQSWMDKVIDALSDYHAILMSVDDDHSLSPDDHMKLTALWTRLELLLKPDEAAAASLLRLADAARLSKTAAERDNNARDMVQLARSLLKTEWVTIQTDFDSATDAALPLGGEEGRGEPAWLYRKDFLRLSKV